MFSLNEDTAIRLKGPPLALSVCKKAHEQKSPDGIVTYYEPPTKAWGVAFFVRVEAYSLPPAWFQQNAAGEVARG